MKLFFALLFGFVSFNLLAQDLLSYQLKWNGDISFEDAQPEGELHLPVFYCVIPSKSNRVRVEMQNAQYTIITDSSFTSAQFDNTAQFSSDVILAQGEALIKVRVFPYRRNLATGENEKLISFSLKITQLPQLKTASLLNEPTNSVLRKGGWVRIATTQSGIYKLSYNDLKAYGFSDPQAIRVYGNGDGVLPELNGVSHKTDLQEVPLQVEDGGNGKLENDEYVLFYANSPHRWDYNTTSKLYYPTFHTYTDSNFYFITTSLGWGSKIQTALAPTQVATEVVDSYMDYAGFDLNDTNLVRSGQVWYRSLGTPFSANFSCPNFIAGSKIFVALSACVRSVSDLSITVAGSDQSLKFTASGWSESSYGNIASDFLQTKPMIISSNPINLTVSYPTYSVSHKAWIDYIAINAPSKLQMTGSQLLFRSTANGSRLADFGLVSSQNVPVWDVTNPSSPKNMVTKYEGGVIHFLAVRDSNREFIAFKPEQYLSPKFSGRVANQNLHGVTGVNMIIVANSKFQPYAQELANYHAKYDSLQSMIVDQQQIFNEYSSGKPDPAALRNFFRNLYLGGNNKLQYVLLFGDGSYNNRNLSKNPNNIITYQSKESMSVGSTFVSDDFFCMLDDNEGVTSSYIMGGLDIGIGRIIAEDTTDARAVLTKILRYRTAPECKGNWQNMMTFLSDDADADWETSFTTESESIASSITSYNKDVVFDKLYLDAFKQESNTGGNSYPEAAKALAERIAKGTLVLNFFGHANPMRLASENILSATDVSGWKNKNCLPLFITAGCQVGRYDDFSRKSLGEIVLTHNNGGGIGILTTTRFVENYSNIQLVSSLCKQLFARENGRSLTLGQIVQRAKNATGGSNQNNFSLLGDPALHIALPDNKVVTDSVNHKPLIALDTLSALETITICGHIEDQSQNVLSQFNGVVTPVLYDKKESLKTLNNDHYGEMNFTSQKNILFKGKASVKNGRFSFSFVLPKDIAYKYDFGKLSYFATDGNIDANGNAEVMVGGTSKEKFSDTTGPSIKVFINDASFQAGGLTDQNPVLLVHLSDQTGFNLSNASIGHSATAVLDSDLSNVFVLNDFYESETDIVNKGYIKYPFYNLTEGEHTVSVKMWDVFNNSATAQTSFVVASSAKFALTKILACPNPFASFTVFSFEHNQQAQNLDAEISIFSMSGEKVKTIHTTYFADGFTDQNIASWDGSNDGGSPIGHGLYLYRIQITNAAGEVASKIERVVYIQQ